MVRPHLRWVILITACLGCSQLPAPFHRASPPPPGPGLAIENPIFVPVDDHELVWSQVVDAMDDYFQIQSEERVQFIGGVITEGRIETIPRSGATLLEPWRRDSTRGFEKIHATLQSVRRRASARLMPVANGYSIEVAVFKELEAVDRAEHATIGGSTLRYDDSLVRGDRVIAEADTHAITDAPITLGWIAQGRDVTLEHEILANIRARLGTQNGLGSLPPAAHPLMQSP